MYDTGKIVTGLVIFLVLISFPIWFNAAGNASANLPEPEIVTDEEQCIEDTEFMKAEHMDLLIDWRQTVVRDGIRTYVASDGRAFNMSLTGTCLSCHSNKEEFCDECHNSVGAQPNCWNCHNIPEETE